MQPRYIVNKLVEAVERNRRKFSLCCTVLTGAAGEGKSTALRQVIWHLIKLNPDFRVIWWSDQDLYNLRKDLTQLAEIDSSKQWLIVVDDPSHEEIQSIRDIVISRTHCYNIQFLLACQDIRWLPYDKKTLWKERLVKEVMPKIVDEEEAKLIINPLEKLDLLSKKSKENAALELLREQKQSDKPVLLAALHKVRENEFIDERVERILERIEDDSDAFMAYAYTVAMHAEGFPNHLKLAILDRAISDWVTHQRTSDSEQTQPEIMDVLSHLGDEIIFTSDPNKPVLVRHKVIADIAKKLLIRKYSKRFEGNKFEHDVFSSLAVAAQKLEGRGLEVHALRWWQHTLPDHFAEQEEARFDLAIAIAKAVYDEEKSPNQLTHLAELFIASKGHYKDALEHFQEFSPTQSKKQPDRMFYEKWGQAHLKHDNWESAICFLAIALADKTPESGARKERDKENVEKTMVYLSSMGLAFYELSKQPGNDNSIHYLAASAILALRIKDLAEHNNKERTIEDLEENLRRAEVGGISPKQLNSYINDPNLAFRGLVKGIKEIYQNLCAREDGLPDWIQERDLLKSFYWLRDVLRVESSGNKKSDRFVAQDVLLERSPII